MSKKDNLNILKLQKNLEKKKSAVEKAKEEQRYYRMRYPLIDDIKDQSNQKEFIMDINGTTVVQWFVSKPLHTKFGFIQKLKYIWDILLNRAIVVYYFEDINKHKPNHKAAYLKLKN